MTEVRAADLPVGSVVATDTLAFIRVEGDDTPWRSTGKYNVQHRAVDIFLESGRAQVLRVGDGSIEEGRHG